MKQYTVTGMSCAACQARVEQAVSALPGVRACAVNLLTGDMGVEGSATPAEVIQAVTDAGYGASPKGGASTPADDAPTNREASLLLRRLIASLCLLLPLMYVSMGHMMWNFPLPAAFAENPLAIGLYQLLLTAAVLVINQKFFVSGFRGLLHGAPNMDTLVALGATASFGYSVYALFAMSGAVLRADHEAAMGYMHEFYFESAAMILTLITLGKLLEAHSKGKTTDALRGLNKLAPKTARLLRDGKETEVPIAQLHVGDLFTVKPGESLPADGVITAGNSAVNEAALTGESIPVDKAVGDAVSAATVNQSGHLVCRATAVGEDTLLSGIIRMVSDAAATKAPIAKVADRVSGVFVPTVMGIAAVTFVVWMLAGQTFGFALARAISVLVISCPCALGLATPVAIMVGSGVSAKQGILFKTAVSLEETGKIRVIALDKTGTVTEGKPTVKAIFPAEGITENELLTLAYSLEVKSEHPLAHAIVERATADGLSPLETTDFAIVAGGGLTAAQDGVLCAAGNRKFMERYAPIGGEVAENAQKAAEAGMTPLYFAKGGKLCGMIAVADSLRPDSQAAIRDLKALGIHVVMLTGDNPKTAAAIGAQAGVDEVIAGVLPNGKAEVVRRLQAFGKVAMVGDGINDAPALAAADMGVAVGAGADVAIDAADVVLMKSNLADVAAAIRISRATLRNIHENLFWAFFYNAIGIPLAAGVWIPIFGWALSPMFGAAAMSLSSFCVVSNALRLNRLRPYDSRRDRPIKHALGKEPLLQTENKLTEDTTMKITVTGMMCHHCEAHVKEALEKIAGIASVAPDHETNTVTIETTAPIAEAEIRAAIEAAGYTYGGVQ